jgi:imidazoleglycerol-phosphate dehydratase/histidinol-phosphatase
MKAVFLDRDGTIIMTPPGDEVVNSIKKVKLFDDTIASLSRLAQKDFTIFIVTNQSGISQGLLSVEEFWEFHRQITKLIEPSGIVIEKTVMCPHSSSDRCVCRKPQTTMVDTILNDYDIDLTQSYTVGDRSSDVQLGDNLGTKTIYIDRTNNPLVVKPSHRVNSLAGSLN